jgi:hypothetical protein
MVRHPLKIDCPTLKSIAGYRLLYTLMLSLSLTYRPPIMMHHYRTGPHISFPHSITTCLHFNNPLIENNHCTHVHQCSYNHCSSCRLVCASDSPLPSFSTPSRSLSSSEVERERHTWSLCSCTTYPILCDCPHLRFSSSSKFRCDVNVQVRSLAC